MGIFYTPKYQTVVMENEINTKTTYGEDTLHSSLIILYITKVRSVVNSDI